MREIKPWIILKKKTILENKWLSINADTCQTASGAVMDEFYVEKRPDFVIVIAWDKRGRLLVERQYRYGLDKVTTEVPAGMIEKGEDALNAARRELLEETGYEANTWTFLFKLAVNAATNSNFAYCYMAQDLHKVGEQSLEPTEDLEYMWMSKNEVMKKLNTGGFEQAFITAAIYRSMELRVDGKIETFQEDDRYFQIMLAKYDALVSNRVSQNELIWSAIPADFTAQAFLYMIILDSGGTFNLWAKAIAGFLSAMIGILTIQLFERHRVIELADSIQLEAIEKKLNEQYHMKFIIHNRMDERNIYDDEGNVVSLKGEIRQEKKGMFGDIESTICWKYGLWIFSAISLFVCINSFIHMFLNPNYSSFQVLQFAIVILTGVIIIGFSLLAPDRPGKVCEPKSENRTKSPQSKKRILVWKSKICFRMVIAMVTVEILLLFARMICF